ncbi:MAG: GNAT family N-acetyltransferase [Thermoproteota archaeon]
MAYELRPIRRQDVAQVVRGWNACLPYDKISKEAFESIVFGDPNFEEEGNVVAALDQEVVGFSSAVAREGVAGRDGRGREREKDFGYIKGLFALEGHRSEGLKTALLDSALDFLRSKGKKTAKVGQYTGRFFFPGIDVRYEKELGFYRESGFEEVVALDLADFQPTEYQRNAMRRAKSIGVVVEPYQPKYLEKMRRFVEKLNCPQWFPEGWESDFAESGNTLVALLGTDVVGWASFHPSPDGGDFGPIAVLEELRGNGIGTCLLLESVLRMKELATPNVTAIWANVPFYVKNGWKVSRRYAVLQREL